MVLASGSGVRVGGDRNKVYLPLGGRSVLAWSLRAFAEVTGIGTLVLVVRPQDERLARRVLTAECAGRAVEVVHGGAVRQESELMGLRRLRSADNLRADRRRADARRGRGRWSPRDLSRRCSRRPGRRAGRCPGWPGTA